MMNAFFWTRNRKKTSKELIATADALTKRLSCVSECTVLGYRDELEALQELSDTEIDELRTVSEELGKIRLSTEANDESITEELERCWFEIRSVFHGWDEEQIDREEKMNRMAEYILLVNLFETTLNPNVLHKITFETRKCVGNVFRAMTVHNLQGFADFLKTQHKIMVWLAEGYKSNETALVCGSMLRDCFEYESLTIYFLRAMKSEFAYLFDVIRNNSNFEISADAFMNVTRLLMAHKEAILRCLDEDFDRIFGLLNGLLETSNYVIKRQALQLLSELLLDPVNFIVMQRYISCRTNLKLVMLLLREPSDALRMDAFHVFKIFVANPNKSKQVRQLLYRNREKLLSFVKDFGKSENNREFLQERSLLIYTLERMQDSEEPSAFASPKHSVPASPTSSSVSSSSAGEIEISLPIISTGNLSTQFLDA